MSDTATLVTIGTAIGGAFVALWAVITKYITRLEEKQDKSETKREEQGAQIIELVSKQANMDGRIDGYLEAKDDLKTLATIPEKVHEIHVEVLKITDAVSRDNG